MEGGIFKYSLNEAKIIWEYGPGNVIDHIIDAKRTEKFANFKMKYMKIWYIRIKMTDFLKIPLEVFCVADC